jgi:hypothetical protein
MAGNHEDRSAAEAPAADRVRRREEEAAGYVGATTEIPGPATKDHPYELARTEVLGSWGLVDPAASLRT